MRRRTLLALAGGAAATRPNVLRAQPRERIRRVGILMSTAEADAAERSALASFVTALGKLGWVPGRNVEIVPRWGAGDTDRMQANAQEMAALAPDVILVKGASLPAARHATLTIPLVFVVVSDAVAQDTVGSFARPAGNITGFASNELSLVGKRLELLRDLSPATRTVLYVRSLRLGTATQTLFQRIAQDAAAVGVTLIDGPAESEIEIEHAVTAFASGPNRGMVVAFDAFTTVYRTKIVGLAAQYRLPAVYPLRAFAEGGGLCSYGFNQEDQFRQAASYVDRILKGERPGDLPVQEPTKFELVINLKTTKALGLTISSTMLALADEVIE